MIVLPFDKHIAAGTEIQLTCWARRSSVGSSSWRPRCRTTSTGSSGVDRHGDPGQFAERHPGQPSTTRVTILTGRRMTDLVLPSTAPIESYVDETVSVLAEILDDTPPDVLAGFDFNAQGCGRSPGPAPRR